MSWLFGNDRVSCDTSALVCDASGVFVRLYLANEVGYDLLTPSRYMQGVKSRMKKHLHTVGGKQHHEHRPPASGTANNGKREHE